MYTRFSYYGTYYQVVVRSTILHLRYRYHIRRLEVGIRSVQYAYHLPPGTNNLRRMYLNVP